ncbi:MAG: Mur ligase domain-containing protein [Vampirovibrionales bacterium]|nr:Mur ligase domain-containing protein [Vampirovibrionales bacterium]
MTSATLASPMDHAHHEPLTVLSKTAPVHFIGVGGIGMSGLAKILLESGYTVTGSDLRSNDETKRLHAMGATIHTGHSSENLPINATVVLSTAVSPNNPEWLTAQELGLPCVHRSELLRWILESPEFGHTLSVGISGSHGKTSTTGMTACGLAGGGLFPTAIAGGLFPASLASSLTNAVTSTTKTVAVAELDESDGSLLAYTPDISVLLNLEMDHAEHFPEGIEGLRNVIHTFVEHLATQATAERPKSLLLNVADPELLLMLPAWQKLALNNPAFRLVGFHNPFGSGDLALKTLGHPIAGLPVYTLTEVAEDSPARYRGVVNLGKDSVATLSMTAPGKHQLVNGMVALAIAHQLKQQGQFLDLAKAAEGISDFTGMGRRFEVVGRWNGATLVDDYAHHPTEVAAMVTVGKSVLGNKGSIIGVFQPHRYTRLREFWEPFAESLLGLDEIIITDVYEASEPPIEGITGEAFTQVVREKLQALGQASKPVSYVPRSQWNTLITDLKSRLTPYDWVMSIGAGDITALLRGW